MILMRFVQEEKGRLSAKNISAKLFNFHCEKSHETDVQKVKGPRVANVYGWSFMAFSVFTEWKMLHKRKIFLFPDGNHKFEPDI